MYIFFSFASENCVGGWGLACMGLGWRGGLIKGMAIKWWLLLLTRIHRRHGFLEIWPPWWCQRVEIFPRYWPFVRVIHRSPVNSPHKGQWCGALMFSLICAWMNGWVNNRETGDLRRHHAHYDVTVMRCAYPRYWSRGISPYVLGGLGVFCSQDGTCSCALAPSCPLDEKCKLVGILFVIPTVELDSTLTAPTLQISSMAFIKQPGLFLTLSRLGSALPPDEPTDICNSEISWSILACKIRSNDLFPCPCFFFFT